MTAMVVVILLLTTGETVMMDALEAIKKVTGRFGVSNADTVAAIKIINSGRVDPVDVVKAIEEIETAKAWLCSMEHAAGLILTPTATA